MFLYNIALVNLSLIGNNWKTAGLGSTPDFSQHLPQLETRFWGTFKIPEWLVLTSMSFKFNYCLLCILQSCSTIPRRKGMFCCWRRERNAVGTKWCSVSLVSAQSKFEWLILCHNNNKPLNWCNKTTRMWTVLTVIVLQITSSMS